MADLSLPLSPNFTLGELLRSNVAERDLRLKEEQENPPPEIIENLKYLVTTTLQPIRDRLGYPIRINSGYRCPMVNKLVGGSGTSQHVQGEAADCELSPLFLTDPATRAIRLEIQDRVKEVTGRVMRPDVSANFYLFALICLRLDDIDVDQVIHEYGEDFGRPAWVHVAASRRRDRRQILFVGRYTRSQYVSQPLGEALSYATARA